MLKLISKFQTVSWHPWVSIKVEQYAQENLNEQIVYFPNSAQPHFNKRKLINFDQKISQLFLVAPLYIEQKKIIYVTCAWKQTKLIEGKHTSTN